VGVDFFPLNLFLPAFISVMGIAGAENFLVSGTSSTKYSYSSRSLAVHIVYLHRISDPRFGGLSRQNLKISKALFGTDAYKCDDILGLYY